METADRRRIDYAPSQEVAAGFRKSHTEAFAESVQLVGPMAPLRAARARFLKPWGASESTNRPRSWLRRFAEAAYRFIARRRSIFYWLTRLTFGTRIEPAQFVLTQWLFLRLLAAIYMVAFASLAVQVTGLLGEHGISPANTFFEQVGTNLGWMRFWAVPSLFWLNSTDAVLAGAAWAGVVLAAVLLIGRLERLALTSTVRPLSFFLPGGSGIPILSMGRLTARSGIPGDLFRAHQNNANDHRLVVSLAGFPAVLSVRLCEVRQQRSGLAQPERARFPLLDAAAADHRRPGTQTSCRAVPACVYVYGARRRTRRAVPDLRAAADPGCRGKPVPGTPSPDLRHRQLHLLQPAYGSDHAVSL